MDIYRVNIELEGQTVDTPYVKLRADGLLEIARGYAWDGPSGPTLDTPSFMRGSLVHDALYQLIRIRKLPLAYREFADLLLQKICLEDGMCPIRAGWVYLGVKLFGGKHARPGSEKPDRVFRVPRDE